MGCDSSVPSRADLEKRKSRKEQLDAAMYELEHEIRQVKGQLAEF